jgi:parallel beta-helix repeat protein
MPLTQLAPPYPVFTDKNGDPLDAGYLYFGTANLNPETNPIQVYYDAAFTQPAAQPLRTSNGYVMRNGSPALIYANAQFSVTVRNKNNELVIYSPVGYGITPGTTASRTDQMIYNEGSSGAVDRVLTSRLQDFVSVKDFGAVGNGVANDTAAIQAAFSSGATNIWVPQGTYRVSGVPVNIPSNVRIKCDGKIIVTDAIPAASYLGAFVISARSSVEWDGGLIDFSGFPAYDNNIFFVTNSTDVTIKNVRIIDANNDRFPLGPVRGLTNNRLFLKDIVMTNVGGIGYNALNNTNSVFDGLHITTTTNQKSAIDTSGGGYNRYANCTVISPSNTTTSAFSFNDPKSVCTGNVTVGGAFGITVGHAPYPADHSAVTGNVINAPASIGINIQASKYATITGNTVNDTITGITVTTLGSFNVVTGNTVFDCSYGVRINTYCVATGNIVVGASIGGYQPSADNARNLHVGNGAFNGTGVGFRMGIAASQINNTLVGNLAGDSQGVPTQTVGFSSLSARNNLFGNSTDGNHVTAEFQGVYSSIPLKDTSDTNDFLTAISDGDTGGTGSAGAGKQYVELQVGTTTYKVLHDGTV